MAGKIVSTPEDTQLTLTAAESKLMRILLEGDGPVGARAARRLLLDAGIDLSEATVSRVLARLDSLGLTEPIGRKGRRLTPTGRRITNASIEVDWRNNQLDRALHIRTEEQLLDLLHARRGVERELARAAAVSRSENDMQRLEESIRAQRQAIESGENPHGTAMSFHRLIAECSGNELLSAISMTLWSDTLAPLETLLDIVTAGHGTLDHAIGEHEQILRGLPPPRPRGGRAQHGGAPLPPDRRGRGVLGLRKGRHPQTALPEPRGIDPASPRAGADGFRRDAFTRTRSSRMIYLLCN